MGINIDVKNGSIALGAFCPKGKLEFECPKLYKEFF